MAAAAAPAGAGVPSAPARRLLRMADVLLDPLPVPPATPASQLRYQTPRNSPVVSSLKFVTFLVPPAPAQAEVDAIQLFGVCLAATNWASLPAAELTALDDADFVVNHYSHVRCSEIILELSAARIFDTEHDTIERRVRTGCSV